MATRFAVLLCAALAGGGCRTQPLSPSSDDGGSAGDLAAPDGMQLGGNPVDILIVYNKEPGTTPLRDRLRADAANLFKTLAASSDWHVGIVSADMGVGRFRVQGCDARGDDGKLNQTQSTCNQAIPAYLAGSGAGASNFVGDPSKIFASCYLGQAQPGCQYQQPWAAMLAALQPNKNPGFLRPNGGLGILIVADTDDCSLAPNSDLFDPNRANYGPESSLRCIAQGASCTPSVSLTQANNNYSNCQPNLNTGLLLGASDVMAQLQQLTAGKQRVAIVTIAGGSALSTSVDPSGALGVDSVCQLDNMGDVAESTPRIARLDIANLPTVTAQGGGSVCDNTYALALALVATKAIGP